MGLAGFSIREAMTGNHEFQVGFGPPGVHPFGFRLTWGPERITDWLNPLGDRFLWQGTAILSPQLLWQNLKES